MTNQEALDAEPWEVHEGPAETFGHGHDAELWTWGLRQPRTGLTAHVVVKVSRTAMAVDSATLTAATRDARNTSGLSEVNKVLDWWDPPRLIELHTASEEGRPVGGSKTRPEGDGSAAERRILEIERLLDDRGIIMRLEEDEEHDRWMALIIPKALRVGTTDIVLGKTRLEASESALVLFENYPAAALGGNKRTLPSVVSAGVGSGEADPFAEVEEERRQLEEVLTDFGWRIAFTAEPDGSYFWLVLDIETGEPIKGGTAESWDDALLAAIEGLKPLSGEH